MNREAATEQVRHSLASYLESQGINLRKNFHCLSGSHADNKPSMSYKASGNNGYPFVHCFACGATYDTISLIAHDYGLKPYSRESFDKAYELFGLDVEGVERNNLPSKPINIVNQNRKIEEPAVLETYDFTEQLDAAHQAMLNNREARRHFAARHYSSAVVTEYKLGFCEKGHNDLLRGLPDHMCKSKKANLYQYVYPIIDEFGKATYFMTEINNRLQCDDYNPKYRKINDLPAPLFNERYLKANSPKVVFVTEGIPDALSVESVGGKAIALTGVGYTRLVELINKHKPDTTFVISLDNDAAGKNMAAKLEEELTRIGCRYIVSGPTFGKDFNEELITDASKFAEEIKKNTVAALNATTKPRKETQLMGKSKITFKQVSRDSSTQPSTNSKPHFKDKTKQMLVDMYLDSLKKDEIPWRCGWQKLGRHINMASGKRYRGKNALLLSIICEMNGYSDNRWMTYNQITEYREKKGITGPYFSSSAKGTGVPITFYGVSIWNSEEEKWEKPITFEKYRGLISAGKITPDTSIRVVALGTWVVFNCSLVNGIEPLEFNKQPIDHAEYITQIINSLGVNYKEEGSSAYYNSRTDTVVLPPSKMFKSEQSYYATQLHELSHSTGHQSRLNRDLRNSFGSPEYALEELNAEIASSFLCADLGLETVDHEYEDAALNHAAYIQNWIQVLENNPEKLFEAINNAQKIEEYVLKIADIDLSKLQEPDVEVEEGIDPV